MHFSRTKIFVYFLIIFGLTLVGGLFLRSQALASSMDLTVTVTSGAAVCGNGTVETGESCDNGSGNGGCPATCSSSCTNNSCGPGGPTAPALEISGLAAGNITVNGAVITFSTSREARCDLRYGTSVSYASSTSEPSNASNHSIILAGLSTSTTYHYAVSCIDSYGMTAQSNDQTFLTLEFPIPLAIADISVDNITDSASDISWTTNYSAICQLRWGTNTDYGGGASSEVDYLSVHAKALSDLAPNTTYHYIINCQDSNNGVASSGDKLFSTLPGPDTTPPANVSGLRAQSGNATSTLFWRNPADADFAGVVIRRSASFYPNLTQGTAVYDGQGVPAGGEMSFRDTGLVNGTVYYYTVFSYDASRNYSSGVGITARPSLEPLPPSCATDPSLCPLPPSCATDPSLCPPPGSYTGELLFSDFRFSQQGQSLAVDINGRVAAQPEYSINIALPEAKVLPNTDKIVLNLSVGGRINAILFAYDPAAKSYAAIIPAISDVGVYYASIAVMDAGNQPLRVVSGSIEIRAPEVEVLPSLPKTVNTVIGALTDTVDAIRNVPAIKAISGAAATPAGQGAAAVTVAASFASAAVSVPLLNWWFLLQFLFTQPLRLLNFRKGWGTVYNAITKRPIDLALVRLYDAKTDRLLASRVTDKNGRYIFLVNPGEYYVKVEKAGFDYPSQLLKRARDDGNFLDLYYGDKFTVAGDDRSAIIANIPIDQQDIRLTDAEVLRRFSRARWSRSASWMGPVVATAYFLFYPSIFSAIIIAVHFALLMLFRRLAGRKHKKHWGVVYNPGGKNPIKQAITRVFSSEYGRMLEYYVTDDRGRYDFLVGNNKYYVTADKPGFGTAKTPILDLTGKKPEELAITQDLVLPHEGEVAEPIFEAKQEPAQAAAENNPASEATMQPRSAAIAAPPSGSVDLGSLDEIREKMENRGTAPAEGESKKPDESIFG